MTHPYFPRKQGRWVDYNVASFRGTFEPGNMAISIDHSTLQMYPPPGGRQRLTTLKAGDMWTLTYGPAGQTITRIQDGWESLYQDDDPDAVCERSGGWGVGVPGVPLLPRTITPGPAGQFEVRTTVFSAAIGHDTTGPALIMARENCGNPQNDGKFVSRCGVVHQGPWGQLSNVVISALQENPWKVDSQTYNYVWQKGFGLLHFWYGTLDLDGSNKLSGVLYDATEWGDA